MSTITQVADALAAELTGATFSQPLSVARYDVLSWSLKELGTAIHLRVVPQGWTSEAESRACTAQDLNIDLGLQQKLPSQSNAAVDVLYTLLEEIDDYLRRREELTNFPDALWQRSQLRALHVPEHLAELAFTGVLTVTYRVLRD